MIESVDSFTCRLREMLSVWRLSWLGFMILSLREPRAFCEEALVWDSNGFDGQRQDSLLGSVIDRKFATRGNEHLSCEERDAVHYGSVRSTLIEIISMRYYFSVNGTSIKLVKSAFVVSFGRSWAVEWFDCIVIGSQFVLVNSLVVLRRNCHRQWWVVGRASVLSDVCSEIDDSAYRQKRTNICNKPRMYTL